LIGQGIANMVAPLLDGFAATGAIARTVLLSEVQPNVRREFERGGWVAHLGADNVVDTIEQALERATQLQAS